MALVLTRELSQVFCSLVPANYTALPVSGSSVPQCQNSYILDLDHDYTFL